ncbi:MAG: hypothetical protein LBP52_03595 [Burkholderiaceae bacterium]|nr:hypothetical protein [Burkholderiaceae bacterium]
MKNPQPLCKRGLCLAALLAAAAGTALLGGCATSGAAAAVPESVRAAPADQKAALLERALAYWAAIREGDRATAWRYEEASQDPRWTLDAYLKRGGIVYNSVEVRDIRNITADTAVVEVFATYNIPMLRLQNQEAVMQDQWRLLAGGGGGQWFHAWQDSVAFQLGKP